MLSRQIYRDCIKANLASRGFGDKRTEEVLQIFERHVKAFDRAGTPHHTADFKAMKAALDEVTYVMREKAKRAMKNFAVMGELNDRAAKGENISTSLLAGDRGAGLSGGRGVGVAYGVASILRADPRVGGLDLVSVQQSYFKKYWALMSDVLDNFSKGSFGVQKGTAHFPNIARELFGKDTGDLAAKEIAMAYRKVADIMADDFNRAGGSLRKRLDFYMPQKQNRAKIVSAGMRKWVDDHMDLLDWGKTVRENGDLIPANEQRTVLEQVYDTLFSDGANKISPTAMRGTGHAVGNQLEKHRFLVYKDADSWLKMHELYGDGTVYDVISDHIERMSRQTAQVDMLGTNPAIWIQNAKAVVKKRVANMQHTAQSLGKKDKKTTQMMADADSAMRRVEDLFAGIMHENSMDTHSRLGAFSTATSNLLMAAQLGSASIAAIPGDLFTTTMVRALNRSSFAVGVGTYAKGMAPGGYGNLERMMARSGYVFDETIMSSYAAERFSGMTTYAAPISRRIGDTVLRLSALTRHTNTARATAQLEQMGLLDEYRGMDFDSLPFKHVMDRYGITKRDWDAVRVLDPSSPNGGTSTFFRPLDILESKLIDRDRLYQKFFSFVEQESKYMVPASTIEASIVMKGTTRPDTMAGMLLQSFAMYKNYPVTFAMNYGRLALSRPGTMTRIGFISGLAVGMTMVGAMAVQVNELFRGRTPIPMDTPAFWGKAFLKGGASGVLGDFLFSGTNEYGRGIQTTLAGPIGGLAGDAINLTVGSVFNMVEKGDVFDADILARANEFARRNVPGSSLWWARLPLGNEIFDRIQEMVDPKARQKWRRKQTKQTRDFGNRYWMPPGESFLED